MNTSLQQWEQINKKELQPPHTAWPTLFLFVVAVSVFFGSIYSTIHGIIPVIAGFILNAVAQFTLFTVLHDASHRSLSQIQWLNEGLGSIASFILSPVAGIRIFRFVHMQHHRFTNEGNANDPDEWCAKGNKWTLPLRWASLDIHYLFWYAGKWSGRPEKERRELIITALFSISLIALLAFFGYLYWVLVLWLISGRVAVTWLALAFDFLPHYPHDVKASENEFKATNVKPGASLVMTPLLLCQNYHLIHHLYPRIPFYRYPWVWKTAQGQLREQGARIMSWNGKEIMEQVDLTTDCIKN
ncbi:fatty acid desaturase [Legionella shakespearei]|uniref:Delta(12)-fatty-acid desaturase n=1 Tax=Legionella shakespearei DSM 23087 TaxID=1122169 RepID=A0A0W0Z8K9_9GAMM|nr:fatty acid desaturase [Legionella shakespearei]KTD65327.1 Delta(12)-fatty-acid desaturase [Legionella shakespearei DSM 23087]